MYNDAQSNQRSHFLFYLSVTIDFQQDIENQYFSVFKKDDCWFAVKFE